MQEDMQKHSVSCYSLGAGRAIFFCVCSKSAFVITYSLRTFSVNRKVVHLSPQCPFVMGHFLLQSMNQQPSHTIQSSVTSHIWLEDLTDFAQISFMMSPSDVELLRQ